MSEQSQPESTKKERAQKERGGRAARQAKRSASQSKLTSPILKYQIPPYNMFSEQQLDILESNANHILEKIGIEFREDAEVLEILDAAGCRIEKERVFFPEGFCQHTIKESAPSQFMQHARNPERSVIMGGDHVVLVPAYGPPFIRNRDEGRRYATLSDFQNFVKLAYMSPGLQHSGGTVCEPVDIPVNKRHLDMVYAHMRYSDKPFMGSVTAPERAQDTVDLCKILFGDSFVDQNCVTVSLINANSPMVWDSMMLGALKTYAKNNQGTVVSPFILSGAMSPVSPAGTLAQLYAEALSGMALTQLIRKGAPVIFGTFAASISMQSGAPTFGTPEASTVIYGAAQLARRLGVPFRSGGGLTASKTADAQAAYESAVTMNAALMAGVNFMLHCAGWLEGGLVMGYEKFIMDAEQAVFLTRLARGPDVSENAQAMDAIKEVGPGSHFLGCAHTLRNFSDAFYNSPISDSNSYEQWAQEGSLDLDQRAHQQWKSMLESYRAPDIDPGIDAALCDFIKERKASMPDKSY